MIRRAVPRCVLAGGAFLAALVCARNAEALLVRLQDGSLASGCGVVAAGGRPRPAAPASLRQTYTSGSGTFLIHYTTDPTDKSVVPLADANGNGIPDWVETAGNVADSVVHYTYERLGYSVNLGRPAAGGGTQYDIYLTELSSQSVYGYTWPGPDPYMQIDNDFADPVYETKGAAALRVTLAHELFHAVQFQYYVGGNDAGWWQEATAVFMEDINYPDINDYVQYLNPNYFCTTLFEDPSLPLDYSSSARCDAHMYGAAVFCHFLNQSDSAHGQEAIRRTFERERDRNSGDRSVIFGALESVMGQPTRDLLASFWVWSYFSGQRSRPHLFFSDDSLYAYPPPSKLPASQWVVDNLSKRQTVLTNGDATGLGARLYRFAPDGSVGGFRLSLSSQAPSQTWSWLAAVADVDTVRFCRPVDGVIAVDSWNLATDVLLVVANGSLVEQTQSFTYTATYDEKLVKPAPEPVVLVLGQNRPNPFNPTTTIPFSISAPADVTATIWDASGRFVRTLVSSTPYDAGDHVLAWDGLSQAGRSAGAGLYLVRLRAGDAVASRRMILLH